MLYVAVWDTRDLFTNTWEIGGSRYSTLPGVCINPEPPFNSAVSLYCGATQVYCVLAGMMLPPAAGVNLKGDPLQAVVAAEAILGLGFTVTKV